LGEGKEIKATPVYGYTNTQAKKNKTKKKTHSEWSSSVP